MQATWIEMGEAWRYFIRETDKTRYIEIKSNDICIAYTDKINIIQYQDIK